MKLGFHEMIVPKMSISINNLLVFFLNVVVIVVGSTTEDEIRSLLEFKKGIEIDPLDKVSSWNRSTISTNSIGCPITWHGVSCDPDEGFVIGIDLQGLGLRGEVKFSTLLGLKNLKNLSLSGNSLSGRLVPALGGMSSLEYLDLSRNGFYGPIPGRINDLWNLHYLNLSRNKFEGGFPSNLGNLNQLRALDLSGNELWGHVGDLVSELRNVEHVDLSSNKFYGGFEMEVEKISSFANTIRHLDLSHNRLNGEFFTDESIKLFRNLEVLDLSSNELQGELPSISALPAFRVFRAGGNFLYGGIPEELFLGSSALVELDLSHNGFSGSLHTINSTTLKVLNLSSNTLSGKLPSTVGGCLVIDLSRNQISGDITVLRNWGASLEAIDLSSNSLSGSFPDLPLEYESLLSIKFSNNSLSGDLPAMVASSPKLSVVDFSLNQFTGSIPKILFVSPTLTTLNLSKNQFTGTIPDPGGRASGLLALPSYPPLESLDLSSNSLTGPLPSVIGSMRRLKLLNLGWNSFSEEIPSELKELTSLEYMDLSNNKFKGHIPDRLTSSLKVFNVSYNDLSGPIPENLLRFPISSFRPGNALLIFPGDLSPHDNGSGGPVTREKHHSSTSIRIAIILACIGAILMIAFISLTYYRTHFREHGFGSRSTGEDAKLAMFSRPSLFKFQRNTDPPPTSLSFSNDHLLTSNVRSISGRKEIVTETVERGLAVGAVAGADCSRQDVPDSDLTSGWRSSPGSPLSSSPNLIELCDQPAIANVYSPDRLAGELFFLDSSIVFTAEELSRAPAEVLGRSSHGTLYKATLDTGHMLTVKWLRVGLVKNKKDFARGAKKVGSIRHPNAVSLRAYYWGPREQERLILADYVPGDSLSLHLYEATPRRYSRLSFTQRLKIAVDVSRCLCYLHDRGLPHGNLKPTNVLLTGPDLTARLTDFGLHFLMTPLGTAEQLLNLGALGYGAPELANAPKPLPSFKADVYALGVILMELLTRRSAGDIISGQAGAVDLTDWVRLCAHEGRGVDCFDRDIAGGEEPSRAMDQLLAASLKCILPVNERPSIRTVFDDLRSISV